MRTSRFLCLAALSALTALVSCNKEPDTPEPLIKTFGFYAADNSGRLEADCQGTISGNEISVGVPPTTDLTELVARYTTNDGNIVTADGLLLVSGETVWNYSSPVSLTVQDEELKGTALYTVKVSLNPDSDPKLTSFKFEFTHNLETIESDVEGTISGDAISVPMVKAADKTALVATFTTSPTNVVKVGDVTQVSGETANDFTNPVDYIVTNSDGSKSAIFSVSIQSVNGKLEPVVTYSAAPVAKAVLRVDPFNKTPYLAYKEKSVTGSESASADKISVVNLQDGTWNIIGGAGFTNAVSSTHFDFDIDNDGNLYVAYGDDTASPKSANVMAFFGKSWSLVGSSAVNDFVSQNISLAAVSSNKLAILQKCNSNTSPYKRNYLVASTYNGTWSNGTVLDITTMGGTVACKGGNDIYGFVLRRSPYHHDVVKYENGAWTSLRSDYVRENAGMTGTFVFDITAAEDGTVCLLTADDAETTGQYRFTVETYSPETKAWSILGGASYPFVHQDSHDEAKVAIAPDGTVYLLYYDYQNTTLRLSWFDSDTKQWAEPVVVATEKLSDINLAFATSGVGYIAFTDENNAEKVFIYR